MTVTVMHLIGSLDRGGAEMVALDLCRNIPADEARQVFLCLSGRAGSMADSFMSAGAVVETAGFDSPLEAFRAVQAGIRRHRPQVVVSHVSLASGWLLVSALMMRVPTRIARFHSEGDGRGDELFRRAYRTIARGMLSVASTRIVAVSRASLEFAMGRWAPVLRSGRAIVIGNGVDTARFGPRSGRREPGEPRVIHIGRSSPEKNRIALVPIFRALDRTMRSRWWVVGPGGPEDLGTIPEERFEVLGDRSDVPELLRSSDVLVLPSLREGLPGVILEALSTGVPVVASDLETLRELAAKLPGITLVPTTAPAERWAAGIAAAIETTDEEALAIRAAVLDSEYTLERSVRDWRRIFGIE
jgi:glycosyltransferase involved in cell wall biosynthesis